MFETFIILKKFFHIQTSAIKRKYPTVIVRIFLVSACTHSISRYIHIQTLCVHKRNVLRFLQHGTYHVVVRGGSHFCQSPKGGGSGVFLLKRKGWPTLFWEKIPKFPSPPPPQEKTYLPKFYDEWDACGGVKAQEIEMATEYQRDPTDNPQSSYLRAVGAPVLNQGYGLKTTKGSQHPYVPSALRVRQ